MATFSRPQSGDGSWQHNTNPSDWLGYVQTGINDEYLKSITLQMGTGIGTFTHSSGTQTEGQGNAIRIRLKIGEEVDDTLYSDIVTLTYQTVATNRNYAEYTFNFPDRPKLTANTQYKIWYSDVGNESYNVICCSKASIKGEAVESLNQMYIYHDGEWHKAKKYIYHDPT